MSKAQVEIIRAATATEIGEGFNEETFQLALRKAKLWMRDAYGSADLDEFISENGGSVAFYYRECLKVRDGIDTENRRRAIFNRRNKEG